MTIKVVSKTRQADPVHCPWVFIDTPEPHFATQWQVVDFQFKAAIGNTFYIRCLEEDGTPAANQYVYFIWPNIDQPDTAGGSPTIVRTDADGRCNFSISSIQRGTTPGPYCAAVRLTKADDPAQYRDSWSELIRGVGNHENRHDTYEVTLMRRRTSTPTPEPEPEPEPEPTPPDLPARVAKLEGYILSLSKDAAAAESRIKDLEDRAADIAKILVRKP